MSEVTRREDDELRFGESARHAGRRRRGPWGAVVSAVAIGLAVVLVSGSAVAAVTLNYLNQQVQANVVQISETEGPPPQIGAIEGGFNILIVGTDTRLGQGGIGGSEEDVTSALNDVNILLHVSQDQTNATAVSFPRDLVVGIPECVDEDGYQKVYSTEALNTALYYGGLQCVVQTIELLTGLPIQFAGMVDFVGVINMSDAIGGVDVCVTGPIMDEDAGIFIDAAGTHNLMGPTALAFLRSRKGVGDGSDLSRISSQQVYLSAMVRKLVSDGTLSDPTKVFSLATAAVQNLRLSPGLADPYTLASIALAVKDIPLERITFAQYPGSTGGTGVYEGKVQPNTGAADGLFAQIASDQPFVLEGVGDDRGSTIDPNAVPIEGELDNSTLPVVPGVDGQTALDQTCSVAY
jgi:LCP family protein required for cell wall assembly